MFRFTIRELVLLTVIVAMGVGWWVDRCSQARTIRIVRQQFQNQETRIAILRDAVLALKERLAEHGDDVTVKIGNAVITRD